MTNNNKQYFTTLEVLERAKEELEYRDHDEMVNVSSLTEEIANNDYYIVYTHEAIKALEQYGVWGTFEAIGEVQEYETENYGEVTTDLSDPTQVSNMVWYILTETTLYDLNIDSLEVSEALEIINEELEHLGN